MLQIKIGGAFDVGAGVGEREKEGEAEEAGLLEEGASVGTATGAIVGVIPAPQVMVSVVLQSQ
jgi:hypothetical protein